MTQSSAKADVSCRPFSQTIVYVNKSWFCKTLSVTFSSTSAEEKGEGSAFDVISTSLEIKKSSMFERIVRVAAHGTSLPFAVFVLGFWPITLQSPATVARILGSECRKVNDSLEMVNIFRYVKTMCMSMTTYFCPPAEASQLVSITSDRADFP